MKNKLYPGILACLVLLAALMIHQTEKTNVLPKRSVASIGALKCTVARFMLETVDSTRQIAPLFENLGTHSLPVQNASSRAQAFFDQGLRLTYAFNHAEGHRSFMEAARLAPSAAMAYWGQAYDLGPNINDPAPDTERKKRAYMEAMQEVAHRHPEHPDVLTLYAAAIMNTMPWSYWDMEGNPAPNTLEAKAALEKAIQVQPDHPGAHHYYIHLMELPDPDRAVSSAESLEGLMPAAGHIVHMPSHIYIRVGRYQDAVRVNKLAIEADEDYISQCFSQGIYPLGYYPHNIHFLWSAASLIGESTTAIEAAQKTAEKVPVGQMGQLHFLQDFASTPLLAYTRSGKWNDILTFPAPGPGNLHLSLMRHYARGIAFIRKGNAKEAREELEAIDALIGIPELAEIVATAHNSSDRIAGVARAVVAGELAALEGDYDQAVAHLEQAVALEDDLAYTEPSAWHIPPRQNLGAVLLLAGDFDRAEAVYRSDLEKLRQNGWSLYGLAQALEAQGKKEAARAIQREFDSVWQSADLAISRSVF